MIKGRIEFNNVFFKYDSNGSANVLNGISFEVCPGEKVALMGPAGAGKSTLVSLLMRFYDASAGTIKLDGLDIMDYSKDFLRDRIGVVLQKPFLFSTTLKDNIAYSDPGTRLDEVIYSARIAHIHDIIEESFPDGYNTLVGEKGVTLSGGQKQRVALARTLLKDPDILILDDSTSSVDTETEFGIRRAMQDIMKNKTVLIIAHRITSVEDCDRIIILNRGKVIEQGTHDELLRLNGFYKKIHDIQLSIEHELEIVSGAEKTF